MSYRNYNTANGHLVDPSGNGDYTTIQAAITAASSGQTVFIRPGTYTENLTLKAGVNLCSYVGDADTPNVTITGKAAFTAAGTVTISGIRLKTNSDYLLAVTGSADSIVNLDNCYIECSNNSGINYTSSSANSLIRMFQCKGDLSTTGIAYVIQSGAGRIRIEYCRLENTGVSLTNSTVSAGTLTIEWSTFQNAITTSSTGQIGLLGVTMELTNITAITHGGSVESGARYSRISTGTATAISVSNACTFNCVYLQIISSNTNCISGAGTVIFNNVVFPGSSHQTNPTTQTGGAAFGLTQGTAPSAGCIGEQIRATRAAGSELSLSNGVAANVTSISLTAGIWDVCGGVHFQFSSTYVGTHVASINTTSATLGTLGDNYFLATQAATATLIYGNVQVPPWRVTLSSTTTVYLVTEALINAGTITAIGRISATRVG